MAFIEHWRKVRTEGEISPDDEDWVGDLLERFYRHGVNDAQDSDTEDSTAALLSALELLLQEVKADMQALACIDLRIIEAAMAAIAAAKES